MSTYNEWNEQAINQLDLQTGLFTAYELIKATKSIQIGKAVGLDEMSAEVWKLDEFQ